MASGFPIDRRPLPPGLGDRPKELGQSGEHMSFIHVGDAAESVMAGAYGSNVIPFPQYGEETREKIISRSAIILEMARDDLVRACGATGATRIIILMLEEMIEANISNIEENINLSRKITRLAKVFCPTDAMR